MVTVICLRFVSPFTLVVMAMVRVKVFNGAQVSSEVPSIPSGPGETTQSTGTASSAVPIIPSGPGSRSREGAGEKMPPSATFKICGQVSAPESRAVKMLSTAYEAFCCAMKSNCDVLM
jgi:hypothetical protein